MACWANPRRINAAVMARTSGFGVDRPAPPSDDNLSPQRRSSVGRRKTPVCDSNSAKVFSIAEA